MSNENLNKLTIGKLSKLSGTSIETIRFYERRSLLPRPSRTASGYRLYSVETVKKLRFIRNAQLLGFSLKEIAELLTFKVPNRSRCPDVRAKAQRKIADVELKIAALQNIKHQLRRLVRSCVAQKTTNDCPIIDALEDE